CQIDAPIPLEYVATSLQTSLDALGALGNPIFVPGSQERTIDRDGLFTIFIITAGNQKDTRDHNIVADVLDERWLTGTEVCVIMEG
ncbi:hypothetical protein P692DRAFT_20839553, partial [Suillus brevipes Sb2]